MPLEIDDQLDLGGLLDWQISRLLAIETAEGCSRHFKRDVEDPVGFSINIEVA
jgi:hypothetical protein